MFNGYVLFLAIAFVLTFIIMMGSIFDYLQECEEYEEYSEEIEEDDVDVVYVIYR